MLSQYSMLYYHAKVVNHSKKAKIVKARMKSKKAKKSIEAYK